MEFIDAEKDGFFGTSYAFTPSLTITFLGVDFILDMKMGSRWNVTNFPRTDKMR